MVNIINFYKKEIESENFQKSLLKYFENFSNQVIYENRGSIDDLIMGIMSNINAYRESLHPNTMEALMDIILFAIYKKSGWETIDKKIETIILLDVARYAKATKAYLQGKPYWRVILTS